ncbi:glycoside hydrolase family protein [uncultured Polaribacter sp.]|uniref:glycoside hydrolase family protein n=1 Tax=uncultured Polaribacter sp. TaxID=174711 RepID=UPI002621EE84|nr:glycoside hydrolase family protein [uncultured Polaribacter sp.]
MKPQKIILYVLVFACMSCKTNKKNDAEKKSNTYSSNMKFEYVGRAAENEGMHVWGSSPIEGKDGRIHLYAAQWSTKTQKNFSGWFKDCEIGHYVSDNPEGPFEYVGVAIEDKDGEFNSPHNPTISYIDGQYQLCFIVNENDDLVYQRIVMMVADDLNDTWRPAKGAEPDGTILRKTKDSTVWNYTARIGVSNPSLVKYKDKYHLYHKSVIKRLSGKGHVYVYGVVVADKVEGPYNQTPTQVTSRAMPLEDAYAFTMNDSVFFVSRDFGRSLGSTGGGLLWKSADGFNFPKEETTRAYEDLAHYLGEEHLKDAKAYRGKKDGHLERAQILFKDGVPTYLYLATGVQTKPGYGSSSHVFKVVFD